MNKSIATSALLVVLASVSAPALAGDVLDVWTGTGAESTGNVAALVGASAATSDATVYGYDALVRWSGTCSNGTRSSGKSGRYSRTGTLNHFVDINGFVQFTGWQPALSFRGSVPSAGDTCAVAKNVSGTYGPITVNAQGGMYVSADGVEVAMTDWQGNRLP